MYTNIKNIGNDKITIYADPDKKNLITELFPRESIVVEAHKGSELTLTADGKSKVITNPNTINIWAGVKLIKLIYLFIKYWRSTS